MSEIYEPSQEKNFLGGMLNKLCIRAAYSYEWNNFDPIVAIP